MGRDRSPRRPGEPLRMSPGRLEAFSDGVFAIAITLLVLDIHVPDPSTTADLAQHSVCQWPSYVAYGVSFLTIGIIWINHHAMLRRIKAIDHEILILNLLLLLCVGLLPFTTALMAAYLKEFGGRDACRGDLCRLVPPDVSRLRRHELDDPVSQGPSARRADSTPRPAGRSSPGESPACFPYLAAAILAVLSPYVSLAICGAVAAFYALPLASGDEETAAPA